MRLVNREKERKLASVLVSIIRKCFESINNYLAKADLYYVVENKAWSIDADGRAITQNLSKIKGVVTQSTFGIKRNSLIHYGAYNLFIENNKFPNNSQRIIATCFHIVDGDERNTRIAEVDRFIGKWHTSCNITKEKLIGFGVPPEKIIVIPIPVNNKIYRPIKEKSEKEALRKKYNIPSTATVVGSFQKDGNGWDEGNTPKLIKGPDVLCNVIEKLAQKKEIYVLLSGPARGYVKNRLKCAGIPYSHYIFDDPDDVAELYRAIDVCFVTSREEGGPKAILESMASGVPIISTKVGMAPELIESGNNGYLVDIGDENSMVKIALDVLDDDLLKERIIRNGLETAMANDIEIISKRYENDLYGGR